MLIDQYRTESYNDDFVPTNEAWITGENENELYQITNEAMESYNCLFENLIFTTFNFAKKKFKILIVLISTLILLKTTFLTLLHSADVSPDLIIEG